jgi:hypothetical protein
MTDGVGLLWKKKEKEKNKPSSQAAVMMDKRPKTKRMLQ